MTSCHGFVSEALTIGVSCTRVACQIGVFTFLPKQVHRDPVIAARNDAVSSGIRILDQILGLLAQVVCDLLLACVFLKSRIIHGERSISEAAFTIRRVRVETGPERVIKNFFKGARCLCRDDGKHIIKVFRSCPAAEQNGSRRLTLVWHRNKPLDCCAFLRDRTVIQHWSEASFAFDHPVDDDQGGHVPVEHTVQRRPSAESGSFVSQPPLLGGNVLPIQDSESDADRYDIAGPVRGIAGKSPNATPQHLYADAVPGLIA